MPQNQPSNKLDSEQLKPITDRMDKTIRLLALLALKDVKTATGKIALLDSLGFSAVEISRALNKPPNYVGAILGQLRKGSQKSTKEVPKELSKEASTEEGKNTLPSS
jgi:hypothetical protein